MNSVIKENIDNKYNEVILINTIIRYIYNIDISNTITTNTYY